MTWRSIYLRYVRLRMLAGMVAMACRSIYLRYARLDRLTGLVAMACRSTYLRYAGLGMLTGMVGMAVMLAQPLFNPPGAKPIRTSDGRGHWSETFRIRKGDIIARTGDHASSGSRVPAAIRFLAGDPPGSSVLTAQVRNASGEVIGVASRYTVPMASGAPPDRLWTLVLTRRGTIVTLCTHAHPDRCGDVIAGTGASARVRGPMVERQHDGGFDLIFTSPGAMG